MRGQRSLFRDSGLPHAFENGLKLGQVCRVVAPCRPEGAGARDGEGRIERQARRDSGMRLIQSAKLRERGNCN